MSSELERRLEGLFHELPQPEPEVGEIALAASLAALAPSARPRRALRAGVLALAAAAVVLAIAAGSLAAAGALHVSLGSKPMPARAGLTLPKGASGVAVVANGRLSVVTRSGFRLQGLPVTAAALSPHALFVAAGIGRSLVAMAPNGRRAWSVPAAGPVVAIAWAPYGNRIAYVVNAGHRFVLHVIWGNGTNDAVIDRAVRAVRPAWRGDSLALAYVGAGGRVVVYDLSHATHRTVPGLGAMRCPHAAIGWATGTPVLRCIRPSSVERQVRR
ncbi:MAG TPA: hypothetical protein VFA37_04525 [Gaiellaceae bacterium]|nr:hypothetical protein [Gaiellaceae bacterium]